MNTNVKCEVCNDTSKVFVEVKTKTKGRKTIGLCADCSNNIVCFIGVNSPHWLCAGIETLKAIKQ